MGGQCTTIVPAVGDEAGGSPQAIVRPGLHNETISQKAVEENGILGE